MRYKIVERTTYKELEEAVQHELNDGWNCQGGIAAVGAFDPRVGGAGAMTIAHYQAMTLDDGE